MTKTLGIVGGLGTETSCSFCLNVNRRIKQMHQVQPHMVMDNVPVPLKMEQSMIRGEVISEMQQLLIESVLRLQASNIIVIPCNTVHLFIDELRAVSRVPILSIIEETVAVCMSFKSVGLLATTTTVKQELYQTELQKSSIRVVLPSLEEQQELSEIVVRINGGQFQQHDRERMIGAIENLIRGGAEAIVFGCSDLFLLLKDDDIPVQVINSTEVLEQAAIRELTEERR